MSTPSAFSPTSTARRGVLARTYAGKHLPLQVLHSAAGHYIGTRDDDGPVSRESVEYFPSPDAAQRALATNAWTQRDHP